MKIFLIVPTVRTDDYWISRLVAKIQRLIVEIHTR